MHPFKGLLNIQTKNLKVLKYFQRSEKTGIKIGNVQIRIHEGEKVFWGYWSVEEQRSRDWSGYDVFGES